MPTTETLWLYFLLVFGIIALPGMDMAFIVGSSIAAGRRAGFAAVAGVTVGGLFHMVFAVTGLFAVIRLCPAVMPIMLACGASYVGWLGWTLLRADGFAALAIDAAQRTIRSSFTGALLTCLMNPKAYLFTLAVFPQFIRPERGPLWQQAATLSAITALTQITVYGALVVLAVSAKGAMQTGTGRSVWLARLVGLLLIAAALMTLSTLGDYL